MPIGRKWFVLGCLGAIFISYLGGGFILRLVFPTFRNLTGAMEPTIGVGEFVITRRTSGVERGDVITLNYPLQPATVFVKRVVGMPGDVLQIRDKHLYINDAELAEPYAMHDDQQIFPNNPALPEPYRSRDQYGPYKVPADSFFVMGDNRDKSFDSRYWGIVPRANIRGIVILISSPARGLRRP
jgi:signal peptidase I